MMSEHSPESPPGHLDIDAVSAYIDRDFGPSDLNTLESHLAQCPACAREVLEIQTAVLLLAGLPQYEPRRSFCLGLEHARASRRRGHSLSPDIFAAQAALPGQPSPAHFGAARTASWLPGLHAAALVVGALLLLVTVGDLAGLSSSAPNVAELAAPTALAESQPQQAVMPAPVADNEAAPATGRTSAFLAAEPADGTGSGAGASEGVPAGEAAAPRLAATVAVASVTQAVSSRQAPERQEANPAAAANAESAQPASGSPSRLRMLELTLAIVLAWLVVSIAGLRWIRRTR
jgi:hypothetical protein